LYVLGRMEIAFAPQALLEQFGSDVTAQGETSETVRGIAALERAQPGDLSFLGNKKYAGLVAQTQASVVLVPEDFPGEPPQNQLWLRCKSPSLALAKLCAHIEAQMFPPQPAEIHPSAVVDASAEIGEGVRIGPCAVIEAGVKIGARTVVGAQAFIGRQAVVGEDCYFHPRVTVAGHCQVGNRVRLQSGCIIGGEGFGYETVDGVHQRIPQVGIVILEDDVEVGANSTIDRARFEATRIGAGTKIDNLVMIAHNVETGKGCIMVSQSGISGSTRLGNYVVVGGQVGLVGHIKVGDKVMIGAQSGVNHDIPEEGYVRGSPARPYMQQQRIEVCIKKLPELFKRFARVEELAEQLHNPDKTAP